MINQSKQKLVLIGAGHANIQVLHGLARMDRTLFDLVLISDVLMAPYSGMLPSFLVGDFESSELHFDLKKICDRLGFQCIFDQVKTIDSQAQLIQLTSGSEINYDLAAINVGIQPQPIGLNGQKSVLFIKPISKLIDKWKLLDRLLDHSIVSIVGGGASAFEIAVACSRKFKKKSIKVQLVAGEQGLLPSLNLRAQDLARMALKKMEIQLFEGSRVQEHLEGALKLENGKMLATTISLVATSAQAPEWFKSSGLPTNPLGFVQVQSDLLIEGHQTLFAAGDCIEFINHALPKAGVFAVRQGPILLKNIKSLIRGQTKLQSYKPQKDFLTILISGPETAIASKASWAFEGRLAWILKNWIDRRFIKRFS